MLLLRMKVYSIIINYLFTYGLNQIHNVEDTLFFVTNFTLSFVRHSDIEFGRNNKIRYL